MGDIGEGIGGAIEGALAGHAVEPRHGERSATGPDGEHGNGTCLNCGTELIGSHCHQCGQNRHIHRTISAIGHDLMHGVLHLDGKLWRTLPLLAFKPGKLTRRYIDGERAKFVSPMAMFLFSVFLMFAVFQAVGIKPPADFKPDVNVGETAQTLKAQGAAEADRLREQIAALPEGDPKRIELEENLVTLEKVIGGTNLVAGASPDTEREWNTINFTGIEAIDKGIVKKWNENPGLVLYKMQANAYKFSWLLIPLSIPFVWLMFAWKRRFRAYDHAIFITYSLAFMSLLFITLSILGAVGVPAALLVLPALLVPPIHLYKQLRHTYEIGRFSAFWRLMVLSGFIWIVVILFIESLILLGAF